MKFLNLGVSSARRCIAPGCPNPVVRVCVRDEPFRAFGLCAFHVRRAILYMQPEQIDRLVFPEQA